MKFSAGQIAQILGGKVEGNAEVQVDRLAKIEEAEKGSLTFLANPVYTPFIYSTRASIVIVQDSFKAEKEINAATTLIRVENAYDSFARLLEMYDKVKHSKTGREENSVVSPKATVGKNVYVGSGSYISDQAEVEDEVKIYPQVFIGEQARVGKNTVLYPGVKIYNSCVIGANCIIHSGVVIGGDGFGFSPNSENNYKKVPQIGNVVIGDNVEIGSNTTIDRATLGSTIIGKGVKIDNLVQIAHNVEIGENTVIAAQCGIAGSVSIGKNCMIGGQVGFKGHITIGDNVKIAAQSGVGRDLADNEAVMGSPAFDYAEYQRVYVNFRNLAKLSKRIDKLEKDKKQS